MLTWEDLESILPVLKIQTRLGAGKIVQWFFQKMMVQLVAPTWWITTLYKHSSRDLTPSSSLYVHQGMHVNTNTYKIKGKTPITIK